jgi:hypothetical protein
MNGFIAVRWMDVFIGTPPQSPTLQLEADFTSAKYKKQVAEEAGTLPLNVFIWTFDSVTRNTFIRTMPQSWDYMEKTMRGVMLEGFNIIGLNTIHALTALFFGTV